MRLTPEQFRALESRHKPKNKYGAKKKMVNGIEFDSTKEARRYQDLELMQKAGEIRRLRRQVPFTVFIKNKLICEWLADFVYDLRGAQFGESFVWETIIEDTKGYRTEVYKLKRKMVQAEYGFKILET